MSIFLDVLILEYRLSSLQLNVIFFYYIERGNHVTTSLTGVAIGVDVTSMEKIWSSLQAIGNIAFSYAYSMVLVEIQAIPHDHKKILNDESC